jgi:RNA polymerase sigma factor (sigma-70 family)
LNEPNTVSEETISKAMQGDTEAFSEIYRTYYKRVYFMGVQYFKNEDTAKDVVQEVFIKVHKQIHTLKTPKAFSSWLHVLTYRICQNRNRRKLVVYELSDDVQVEDFADTKKVDIVDKIENERIKEVIMSSLDGMSDQLRMVGVLRFFEELKIEEISEILDVPKSTIGTRLVKIKKILRIDLEKHGIHNNYGFAILTPALMYEAYELLFKRYELGLNEASAERILLIAIGGGAATATSAAGGITFLSKVIIGGLTTATVLGGGILLSKNNNVEETNITFDPPPMEEMLPEIPVAKIEDINYDPNWRNSVLDIDVTTTNSNFDKILVNEIETLQIDSNGTYVVKLLKDNSTIDEKEITFSMFDRNSPVATGTTEDDTFVIFLNDDLSGIDWGSITHYKNGVLANEYVMDIENSKLIIQNDNNYSTHELFVMDNAGNELNIKIQ